MRRLLLNVVRAEEEQAGNPSRKPNHSVFVLQHALEKPTAFSSITMGVPMQNFKMLFWEIPALKRSRVDNPRRQMITL